MRMITAEAVNQLTGEIGFGPYQSRWISNRLGPS